jgi:hypothetical protein
MPQFVEELEDSCKHWNEGIDALQRVVFHSLFSFQQHNLQHFTRLQLVLIVPMIMNFAMAIQIDSRM